MRAVVQRVLSSKVTVDGNVCGCIGPGMTVLLGISKEDTEKDADYLVKKLAGLRIFDDAQGVMNLNAFDAFPNKQPEILAISQFTLYGDVRKGNRPSYIMAEIPEKARLLYAYFTQKLQEAGFRVETGIFQADMQVEIQNNGPVTILLDSFKTF
ncbi:MAG: D-tyrosyl-tRNA(Tyr) deacylase [Clostridia bacterium]|nr:D-tyrosyl-tRNA(Tyr) deacylase [Clostridia bacterium]